MHLNLAHKLMLIVLASVALVTIPAAGAIYFYAQKNMLANETATLVAETQVLVNANARKLNDADVSLTAISQLLEKDLSAATHVGDNDESIFDKLIQHDEDQAWRSREGGFNGLTESGVFLSPTASIKPEQKSLLLHSKRILDNFGGLVQPLFNNVWMLTPDNSLVIYDRSVPNFVRAIPADIVYGNTPWVTLGDPLSNQNRALKWTPPLFDPVAKLWIVSAVLPVDVNGVWKGMLGHDIYLNNVLPTLFRSSQRYAGELHFLTDTAGNFIEAGPWQKTLEANPENFKPNLSQETDLAKLFNRPLNARATTAFTQAISFAGNQYIAIGLTMQPLGWRYVRLVPKSEILAPMRMLFYALVVMVLVAGLLIGALIDIAVERSVIKRLRKLANAVRNYGAGDLSARSNLSGDDEIANTASAFDAMAEQLKATLDAIPDILFELGLDGHYYRVHTPNEDALVLPSDVLIGKNVAQVLPPESAAVVMAALQEANASGESKGLQFQLQTPQGSMWFELSVARKISHDFKNPRFIVLSRDITERKITEENIRKLAFYDHLTGLPNRRLLLDRLKLALAACVRSGQQAAVLFIDLDHFKVINDTLGHNTGDRLLQRVAERLVACVRDNDTVARLGGDEFVVILQGLSEQAIEAAAQAEAIGNKILTQLNLAYQLASPEQEALLEHHSTPSIGITLLNQHQQDIELLLQQADIAMYQAKKSGRNTMRFFDPQMQATINARVTLENELHQALVKQEFQLYFQLQVEADQAIGAEALIRWVHPERGLISPLQFIPLAEESDLIAAIGEWVLDAACAQLCAWQQHDHTRKLSLSVNVSARQLHQAHFASQVISVVKRYDINPKLLKLELTESMLLERVDETICTMNALKDIGVRFALDDFGTGYSSLQYLKQLPLDQLKIDSSFVRDIAVNSNDLAIVSTVIAMAKALRLNVIAEGVETETQRQLLSESGCHHFQGYLFSKPVSIAQFEALLKNTSEASDIALKNAPLCNGHL